MSGIVIGFTSGATVDSLFNRSIVELLLYEHENGHTRTFRPNGDVISVRSGPRVASARNAIVRTFLDKTSADWLWMLDADMVFTPDTLDQLLAVVDPVNAPIVGALCFGGGYTGSVFPTLYVYDEQQGLGTLSDYPANELIEVDATGAACLMIHRRVLMKLAEVHAKPQWFAESVWDGKEIGEDITFCIRARTAGFPVQVYTGLEVGHVKPAVLDSEEWLTQKTMTADDIKQRRQRKLRLR